MLYNCIIYPLFIYCNVVWGSAYKTYLWSTVQIQKKLVKIKAFKGRYEHEGPIFTELNFLTIEQINVYMSCIYIYKAIQNNNNMFQIYAPIRYNTRLATSSTLVLSNAVATHSRQSIRWQGCANWNKLPLELRETPNYNSFKLNKYLLSRR